jgi:hypothetical protein
MRPVLKCDATRADQTEASSWRQSLAHIQQYTFTPTSGDMAALTRLQQRIKENFQVSQHTSQVDKLELTRRKPRATSRSSRERPPRQRPTLTPPMTSSRRSPSCWIAGRTGSGSRG